MILVVSPLNALMRDQIIKVDSMQVSLICNDLWRRIVRLLCIRNGRNEACKYRIYIYGHPEVFIGKLRKVLDSVEVSEKLMSHTSLKNGNDVYLTSFHNKH